MGPPGEKGLDGRPGYPGQPGEIFVNDVSAIVWIIIGID